MHMQWLCNHYSLRRLVGLCTESIRLYEVYRCTFQQLFFNHIYNSITTGSRVGAISTWIFRRLNSDCMQCIHVSLSASCLTDYGRSAIFGIGLYRCYLSNQLQCVAISINQNSHSDLLVLAIWGASKEHASLGQCYISLYSYSYINARHATDMTCDFSRMFICGCRIQNYVEIFLNLLTLATLLQHDLANYITYSYN